MKNIKKQNKKNINFSKFNFLITGASGCLGSNFIDFIQKYKPKKIYALNLPPIDKYEKNTVKELKKYNNIQFLYVDIRNKQKLEKAIKNLDIDFVVHFAAISRPMKIPNNVYFDTNKKGTQNLLEILKNKNIKKIINISSVSAIGLSPDGHPLKENEYQKEEMPYALSKREQEKIGFEFFKNYNMPIVTIRPSLMYGPRCTVRAIMFKFVKKGLFPLINKGESKFEFCYVDNLSYAIVQALIKQNINGQVFNITDGQSYEIKQVLNTIADNLNTKRPFINIPYPIARILGYLSEIFSKLINVYPPFSHTAADWMSKDVNVYSCDKAKKILSYKNIVDLDTGIKRSIEWYKKNKLL